MTDLKSLAEAAEAAMEALTYSNDRKRRFQGMLEDSDVTEDWQPIVDLITVAKGLALPRSRPMMNDKTWLEALEKRLYGIEMRLCDLEKDR